MKILLVYSAFVVPAALGRGRLAKGLLAACLFGGLDDKGGMFDGRVVEFSKRRVRKVLGTVDGMASGAWDRGCLAWD